MNIRISKYNIKALNFKRIIVDLIRQVIISPWKGVLIAI
jgi:hypothetical protein